MKMSPALAVFVSLLTFGLQAQERSPIYPFDVEVAGQQAIPPGGPAVIFAKIPQPVAPDAEVKVDTEGEMIIVNVFAIDENGAPLKGAQGQAKVIMVQNGTGFALDGTMDKSTLAPGRYGMNIVLQNQGTSRVEFTVGNSEQMAQKPAPTQTQAAPASATSAPAETPKLNMAGIDSITDTPFPAASTATTTTSGADRSTPDGMMRLFIKFAAEGKFEEIRAFADPKCDGDVREICAIADSPEKDKNRYRNFFGGGKVLGAARVDGDKAEVDFTMGDKQEKQETMNLQRIDGVWFLSSF